MTRELKLPDGVPTDNGARASLSEASREFTAPNTATPSFVEPAAADIKLHAGAAKAPRRDLMSREHQNMTLLIAVVTLAMAIGGVLLLRSPGSDALPLCSEQPEWNQYNCRAR